MIRIENYLKNNINKKSKLNEKAINGDKNSQSLSFKGADDALFKTLNGAMGLANTFIKSQENLSSTRFIQDTATNWFPKAIFSRSKEDFCEMSFLEFIESAIFYFASPILGEKLFRNLIFKNFHPKNIKNDVNNLIAKPVKEITSNLKIPSQIKNRAITTKAGIVLACLMIPVAEYTLSFAKNLFTLKTFKKSNFNNIANLDKAKNEKEDTEHQKQVEKSSKNQLKKAAIISAAGVLAGSALAIFGHKSPKAQNLAQNILEPGKALSRGLNSLGVKNEKLFKTLDKLSFDFASNNGKLALSKGQLGLTALVGLFGYSKAAKDRGKLDVYEVWTRVPLVVFYTIFGSELFEKGFIKSLSKNEKYKDIIKKGADGALSVPTRTELPELARKLAKEKNQDVNTVFKDLIKKKTITTGVPYLFSLIFMGFTLSAITRLWTQYRYNHQKKNALNIPQNNFKSKKKNAPNISQNSIQNPSQDNLKNTSHQSFQNWAKVLEAKSHA